MVCFVALPEFSSELKCDVNLFGPKSNCTQLEHPYGTHHNSLTLLGFKIKGEDEDVFAEKESLEDEFGWEAVGHMGWKEAWQVGA